MSEIEPTDQAYRSCRSMWRQLGNKARNKALEAADNRIGPDVARDWARFAEACFWQATGEMDSIDLSDLLKDNSDD